MIGVARRPNEVGSPALKRLAAKPLPRRDGSLDCPWKPKFSEARQELISELLHWSRRQGRSRDKTSRGDYFEWESFVNLRL
jgi:hypothetical protein